MILNSWLEANHVYPYPSTPDLVDLGQQTGLSQKQM
jgi:hypothetical protein